MLLALTLARLRLLQVGQLQGGRQLRLGWREAERSGREQESCSGGAWPGRKGRRTYGTVSSGGKRKGKDPGSSRSYDLRLPVCPEALAQERLPRSAGPGAFAQERLPRSVCPGAFAYEEGGARAHLQHPARGASGTPAAPR